MLGSGSIDRPPLTAAASERLGGSIPFAVHTMRLHHLLQSLTMKHEQTLCASSFSTGDTKTPSLRLTACKTRYSKAKQQIITSGSDQTFTSPCLLAVKKKQGLVAGPPAASLAGEALPASNLTLPYPASQPRLEELHVIALLLVLGSRKPRFALLCHPQPY